MPPTNPTASETVPRLAMPPVPPETEVVDDGHGGKMFRMTAKWNLTADELRGRIADLDRQIEAMRQRYIAPLEARKAELESLLAQLQ